MKSPVLNFAYIQLDTCIFPVFIFVAKTNKNTYNEEGM